MEIKEHNIVITVSLGDFEQYMKRKPKDQAEFDEWAGYVEKGLMNGHIDWQILFECACDAMPGD